MTKEKVYAVYWYDARGYENRHGDISDLTRMPLMRSIGVLREHKDKGEVIVNIEFEKHMNDLGDELGNDKPEGTAILERWIIKKVLVGEIRPL